MKICNSSTTFNGWRRGYHDIMTNDDVFFYSVIPYITLFYNVSMLRNRNRMLSDIIYLAIITYYVFDEGRFQLNINHNIAVYHSKELKSCACFVLLEA